MRNLSAWHVVLLLAVVILIFGAKRLPDVAKSVGQSMKIFKNEIKDLNKDDVPTTDATPTAYPAPPVVVQQPVVQQPVAQQPVAQQPVVQEPFVQPFVQQPFVQPAPQPVVVQQPTVPAPDRPEPTEGSAPPKL